MRFPEVDSFYCTFTASIAVVCIIVLCLSAVPFLLFHVSRFSIVRAFDFHQYHFFQKRHSWMCWCHKLPLFWKRMGMACLAVFFFIFYSCGGRQSRHVFSWTGSELGWAQWQEFELRRFSLLLNISGSNGTSQPVRIIRKFKLTSLN